ncbi:MAG TPA: DUF4145 domain-containing protein [Methylocella sp.]|nr:DUF4145 domain-containing protein [Methylocella sp.]
MTGQDQTVNSDNKIKKAECSNCGGLRNCDVLGQHKESDGNEYYDWWKRWYLLRCRGCENIFVQTVSGNSEDYYDEDAPNGETITKFMESIEYWPARSKRTKPEWMNEGIIDEDLHASLVELYGALDNDLNMLAAIGIRTSFDIAAELLGIDAEQPFKSKLEELVVTHHMGKVDQLRLETLIDAGSASAHRGWRPTAVDLSTMMDVLELFIHGTFVAPRHKKRLDDRIVKMRETVPPRKSKPNAKTSGGE